MLEQLRPYTAEIGANVRGGPSVDGLKPGYREDANVADDSNMETYVAGKYLSIIILGVILRSLQVSLHSKTIIDVVFRSKLSIVLWFVRKPYFNSHHSREGFISLINSKAVGNTIALNKSLGENL